jgi:hypothetical protein
MRPDGRESEPISSNELHRLARESQVLPQTQIFDCAARRWMRADEHPSLAVTFRQMGVAAPPVLRPAPPPSPPPPVNNGWQADRLRLKRWLGIFFLVWLTGALLWGLGANATNVIEGVDPILTQTVTTVGLLLFLSAIIPYLVSLVFAYRVQDKLNQAGLYRAGAWQIIVGGLLLNPWGVGFVIPTLVLLAANRILRAQAKAQVPDAQQS